MAKKMTPTEDPTKITPLELEQKLCKQFEYFNEIPIRKQVNSQIFFFLIIFFRSYTKFFQQFCRLF